MFKTLDDVERHLLTSLFPHLYKQREGATARYSTNATRVECGNQSDFYGIAMM